jgi:cell wall assembly regulator SMI1
MEPNLVADSWRSLEAWACENHPALFRSLAAPAESEMLESVESQIEVAIPKGLRHLLLLCDGQSETSEMTLWPEGLAFLGCSGIEDRWRMLVAVAAELGDLDVERFDEWAALAAEGMGTILGPVRALGMSRRWIPFAAGSCLHYFIDMNPAPGGIEGQVIRVDSMSGAWCVMASSFEEYFASFVFKVTSGAYLVGAYGVEIPEPDRVAFYEPGTVPDYLAQVRWDLPINTEADWPSGSVEVNIDMLIVGLLGSADGSVVTARLANGSDTVVAVPACYSTYSPRLGDLVRACVVVASSGALDHFKATSGAHRPHLLSTKMSLLRPRHLVNQQDPCDGRGRA